MRRPAPTATPVNVDIYYDDLMVPHVFAATDEAALYGLGYQHMRDHPIGTLDRLWRYSGRFSEIVGPSYLDRDYEVRLWEVPAIAARQHAELSPELRSMLEAYVRGVEDGRAWWRNGAVPASTGNRLAELLGTTSDPDNVELNVDPLPDYLNQGFHPFQFDPDAPGVHPQYDAAEVPRYVKSIVDRMFDAAQPITIEHVLRLGVAVSSGPQNLLRANEIVFIPNDEPGFTNAWLLSAAATGGKVMALNDNHTGRNTLNSRPFYAQVSGDEYDVVGFSVPGAPVLYSGTNGHLAWVMSGTRSNRGVTETRWSVRLLPGSGPLRFRFGPPPKAPLGGALDAALTQLQIVPQDLAYFDPVGSSDTDGDSVLELEEHVVATQARTRYYVPAKSSLGLPGDRCPVVRVGGAVVDGLDVVPGPDDTIEFEQSAYTVGASPWELFLRVGMARYIDDAPGGEEQVVDVLEDALWTWDNNLLFADYKSRFYFVYAAKIPIQGPDVAGKVAPEDYALIRTHGIVLDGSRPGERWQGFYGLADLPQIGPVDVSGPEAWISNVTTADVVEVGPSGANPLDDRFELADFAAFPPEIARMESSTNFRQVRAQELLMQSTLTPGALASLSETVALDKADTWMIFMWDFFKAARDVKVSELLPSDPDFASIPDVNRFVDWVEEHRTLSDDGLTYDPSFDFVAHKYSLVTVYTTLLRSWYENELASLSGLGALQQSFGADAVHPLYASGTGAYTRLAYGANIDAMWDALRGTASRHPGVSPLWGAGSGGGGLQNHDVLVNQGVEPWASDPRFDDLMSVVDPNFAGDMAGTRVTRWGMVKLLSLTPHFIPPPRATQIDANTDLIRGYFNTALRPDLIPAMDPSSSVFLKRLQFPVYENQDVLAFPLGGVHDSLFVSKSTPVFGDALSPRAAPTRPSTGGTPRRTITSTSCPTSRARRS